MVEVDDDSDEEDEEQSGGEVVVLFCDEPEENAEDEEDVERLDDLKNEQLEDSRLLDDHCPRPVGVLELVGA